MDDLNPQYRKLVKYVNTGGLLLDLVKAAIIKKEITDPRIVNAASEFQKAEQDASLLHDLMESFTAKLN